MRIEECFSLFQKAAERYDINYKNISFSLEHSDELDFLLCDIAKVIGRKKHKNSKVIANIIVSYLPFTAVTLDSGDIKFNLWQEVT